MSAAIKPRWRSPANYLLWALVFIAMLIMQWPATTLGRKITEVCENRCALGNIEGTLWSGRAGFYSRTPEGNYHQLQTLAWTTEPAALAQGRLAWRLRLGNGANGTISLGVTGWQLAFEEIQLPAASLGPLLEGRFALRGWGGQLRLKIPSLACTWGAGNCQGEGTAHWAGARISSLYDMKLGDYRLAFQRQAADPGWSYHLLSDAGPLWLELHGALDDRQLSLSGPAWLDPSAKQAISPFLAAIGPFDSATERYQLNFTLPISRH